MKCRGFLENRRQAVPTEGGLPVPAKEWATSLHAFDQHLQCSRCALGIGDPGQNRKDTFSVLMRITFQSGETDRKLINKDVNSVFQWKKLRET